MLNGDAGDTVTPLGRPLTARVTLPWNPFRPIAESVTGCDAPPGATETEFEDIPKLKSGEDV
jgi:hypothetical protein